MPKPTHISEVIPEVLEDIQRNSVEILFVLGSSRDRKGKRVLVREGVAENCLWPGDDLTEVDTAVLGLNEQGQQHIEIFFQHSNDDEKNLVQETAMAAR